MQKTNVVIKDNELVSILTKQFKGELNLARVKLIALMIVALCKVQTVTFERLAIAFDNKASADSSLRRIQRFIADYVLCSDLVAKLIFSLLPKQENLTLSIDRTNWKFGDTDINIFMLGVVYDGVAFPLMFKMLDKRGNSNSKERIELIERFIKLFSDVSIDAIVADREFVGQQWIAFLNRNKIKYFIRIRNNFKIQLASNKKQITAWHLFNKYPVGEFSYYRKPVLIKGEYCYLSGCKIKDRNGEKDFLILISYNQPENADDYYKLRWQIETCFRAMKTSGFNIEKTHLNKIDRIEKLLLIVMIAFVWSYKVGIYLNKIKPIKIKTHKRKAKSIFKYGLDHIANTLFKTTDKQEINKLFQFLSCT